MNSLNRLSLASLVLALGAPLVACGGGGGGGGATVDSLPGRWAPAMCSKFNECFGPAADLFAPDCEATLTAQFTDQSVPQWQAAIDAGTLSYDSSKVSACLSAIGSLSCADFDSMPAACDDVFTGTVAAGGSCHLDEECSGDSYCDQSSGCPGTCAARVAAGGDCSTNGDSCQAGLSCNGSTCEAPVAAGGACGGMPGTDCPGGLICIGSTDTVEGTCQPISAAFTAAAGEACDPEAGTLCAGDNVCTFDITGFTCQPKVGSGAACTVAIPDACPAGQHCNADIGAGETMGTCVDLPAAGQACLPTGDIPGQPCADGLTCADGTCVTPARLGEACSGDSACASDKCEGGVCVAPQCG